ncbi:MAG: thioredoxin [Lactobacillaceae bacterium]|jgi:thioredoxin 1|nr:thioredoxin [Lactobacillaceae bacterium]
MTVKAITDANYEAETNTGVTLTDFWATWCGPCKMQAPVIEALADELPAVKFVSMDVDQNSAVPSDLGIRSIPTLLVKKDGEVVERIVGYTPAHELNAILAQYVD